MCAGNWGPHRKAEVADPVGEGQYRQYAGLPDDKQAGLQWPVWLAQTACYSARCRPKTMFSSDPARPCNNWQSY